MPSYNDRKNEFLSSSVSKENARVDAFFAGAANITIAVGGVAAMATTDPISASALYKAGLLSYAAIGLTKTISDGADYVVALGDDDKGDLGHKTLGAFSALGLMGTAALALGTTTVAPAIAVTGAVLACGAAAKYAIKAYDYIIAKGNDR